MKRIAVLSSGTDNCGINGAIRSVVRTAKSKGIRTFGIRWGFRGLMEDHIQSLTSRDVSGRIGKAGCFLGTTRPEIDISNDQITQMLANLNKKAIEGVVVIGGGGSINLAKKLAEKGVPIVAIPSTLQDDIPGTDICLGVDSALNNIIYCVDHIRSCDSSRNRSFLVQVEGRESGSLAYRAAVATGAEVCLVPEDSTTDLTQIAKQMADSNLKGKTQCIAMISAGWKPGINALAKYLEEHENETDLLVRKSILGYVQRGGFPSGYDRLLGTKLGNAAVNALTDGAASVVIGLENEAIHRIPFEEVIGKVKPFDPKIRDLFLSTVN